MVKINIKIHVALRENILWIGLQILWPFFEKVVFNQLNDFLTANCCLDPFQSGFRANHSTETALIKVLNDIRLNSDSGKTSVLVLLDLSAAFDTIDHSILLRQLEHGVGLSGRVINWLKSYLQERTFFVALGNYTSALAPLTSGVPQGSILGPLLFNLYMLPLGQIIKNTQVSYHSYADDTQLYLALSPTDKDPLGSLCDCLDQINSWLSQNFLQLNKEKTEVILFGRKDGKDKMATLFRAKGFEVRTKVRNLGVIIDSDLNFDNHMRAVTRTSFYHLKNIAKLRDLMSQSDLEKLVHAFISSRLDYCNGLFTGLPKKTIKQLQLVQNAAARVLTKTRKREHITPILKSLHWLPVYFRIHFKVLLLVFKALHGMGPTYISDMFTFYIPLRPLRPQKSQVLCIPYTRTKQGEAAFSYYAVQIWNKLPDHVKNAPTIANFKTQLKTTLFSMAFSCF
jgi:hypothetical protein